MKEAVELVQEPKNSTLLIDHILCRVYGQRSTSQKHVTSMSCKLEPAIWSRDTGQQIACFDRCQLIKAGMSNIKEVPLNQGCTVCLCQPIIWSTAAMLGNSVVVVIVRTRPRAIPLAMITMRKSTHGFPFLSHDKYGAPLGGPMGRWSSAIKPLIISSYLKRFV